MLNKKNFQLLQGLMILFFMLVVLPQSIMAQGIEKGDNFHFSFHVGATYPLNFGSYPTDALIPKDPDYLNGLADSNIHLRFNMDYRISERFNAVVILGFSQFTDDYETNDQYNTFNISANIKWLLPTSSGLKWYLAIGPGVYIPKPNLFLPYPTSTTLGFNVGLGAQIPLNSPFNLEWGIDLHNMNFSKKSEPKYWFLTFQLGVLF